MQLTKDFNITEFNCADGTPVPWYLMENVKSLACNLQAIRDYIGEPIFINSAYRTPTHNSKVGGKLDSMHIYGLACDITTKKYTPRQFRNVILKLISVGKIEDGGIGLYRSFVHYDIRGFKARWSY